MSEEKTQKPATPKLDGIAVAHLWFVDALDFNAEQKSNVPCGPELAAAGSSYTCRYIPQLSTFELTCGRNGKQTGVEMIPRERVKKWSRL